MPQKNVKKYIKNMGKNKTYFCQFQMIFNFLGKSFQGYAEHYFS